MTARQYNFTKQNGVVMKATRRFTKQNGTVKRILAGWTKQNGVVEKVFETPSIEGIKFVIAPAGVTYTRPLYATDNYIYCSGSTEVKINVETGVSSLVSRGRPAVSADAIVVFFRANGVAANQSIMVPLGSYQTAEIEYSITTDTCLSTHQSGAQYGIIPLTKKSSDYAYFIKKNSATETQILVENEHLYSISQPFNSDKCAPIGIKNAWGYAFVLYDGKVYICSYEETQPYRYTSKTINAGVSFTNISGAYTPNGQDLFCSIYDPTNKVNQLVKFNTVSWDSYIFQLDLNLPQEKTFLGAYGSTLFFITPVVNGQSNITSCVLEKYDLSGQKIAQVFVDVPAGITYDKVFSKPTVTSTRYASVLLDNTLIWFDLSKL